MYTGANNAVMMCDYPPIAWYKTNPIGIKYQSIVW